MVISDLLNNKSAVHPDHIVSCQATETVGDAVSKMIEHKIGAVLVRTDETVVGIFTERDVVKLMNGSAADAPATTLTNAMSKDVVSITPTETVDEALVLMRDNNIRHLTVMDDDTLIGLISMRDLMLYKIEYVQRMADFAKGQVEIQSKPLPM